MYNSNLIDNDILEKLKELEENYDLILYKHIQTNDKICFLGDKEHRICRFCGRNKNDVSFKKESSCSARVIRK